MRPPPPESPAASRKLLKQSVDMGALDDLVDALGAQEPEQAPVPPPREKWVGGKGTLTMLCVCVCGDVYSSSSLFVCV